MDSAEENIESGMSGVQIVHASFANGIFISLLLTTIPILPLTIRGTAPKMVAVSDGSGSISECGARS
jgi:hypothetical protein